MSAVWRLRRNVLRLTTFSSLPLRLTVAVAILEPLRWRMWILKCRRLTQRFVDGS